MASITTYHCLCTELVLATATSLSTLPKRECDGSFICKLSSGKDMRPNESIITSAVTIDDTPLVLNLEDGFEKRYPALCSRCGLMLGYQLDWCQWGVTKEGDGRRTDVVYVIPGGLLSTEDVASGKKPSERDVEVKAG